MRSFFGPIAPVVLFMVLYGAAMDAGAASRRRRTPDTSPAVGAKAPDFELVTVKWLMMDDAARAKAGAALSSKAAAGSVDSGNGAARPGHVRLSSYQGKKPVLFVLTSYT